MAETENGALVPTNQQVLESLVVTDEKAERSLERLKSHGDKPKTVTWLKDMAVVGRFVRSQGVRDMVRGGAMEVQDQLFGLLEFYKLRIRELSRLRKTKAIQQQILEIHKCIGEATKHMTDSQRVLLETEGTLAGLPAGDDKPPTAESFKPGQVVAPPTQVLAQAGSTVNIHEAKPPTKAPKAG